MNKRTDISASFIDGMKYEQVEKLIYDNFSDVEIHCKNCLEVFRNFREAFRGYLIGKGGSKFGRSPITTFDRDIEQVGCLSEITFVFEDVRVVAYASKKMIHVGVLQPEIWVNKYIEYIKLKFQTNIKELIIDPREFKSKYDKDVEYLFFEELSYRLEEGDLEGGENAARCVRKI
jgi:hypothetical protein